MCMILEETDQDNDASYHTEQSKTLENSCDNDDDTVNMAWAQDCQSLDIS